MKVLRLLPLTLALALPVPAGADSAASASAQPAPAPAPAAAAPRVALVSETDRESYAVGIQTGRALRTADGAEVNLDALVQGLRDGLSGARFELGSRQMTELLGRFQQTLRQKGAAMHARARLDNQKAAEAFFADNKTRPGVVTLANGLQYRVIEQGAGPRPGAADQVTVSYRGTLLNGTEFDATPEGKPQQLQVDKVIPGWQAVLQLMPVGSHWEVYIPPQLGYGDRGAGADIGPDEALVFDLRLIATSAAKAASR